MKNTESDINTLLNACRFCKTCTTSETVPIISLLQQLHKYNMVYIITTQNISVLIWKIQESTDHVKIMSV